MRHAILAFAALLLVPPTWSSASEPVRKIGSDYVMPVTFPVLEIRLMEPHHQLHAWAVEGDGRPPRLVFDAAHYATQSPDNATYHVRLDRVPGTAILAPAGEVTKPAWIDSVAIVTADGKRYTPSGVTALAGVECPQDAREADGKPSLLTKGVPVDWQKGGRLDAGLSVTFDRRTIPSWQQVEQPGPPIRVGIYWPPYPITDPTHVPVKEAGVIYRPDPKIIAEFDFSVVQGNNCLVDMADLMRQIKRINPEHRLIVRVNQGQWLLDYFYDADHAREKMVALFADSIEKRGVPELIHAVAISEEEMGNAFSGIWWTKQPPAWSKKWADKYTRETGRTLHPVAPHGVDPGFIEWLIPKIPVCCNDLFDRLKARWPKMKFLQYMAVSGDGSGISWVEPEQLKADGWIYWSFQNQRVPTLQKCRRGSGEPFDCWMQVDGSMRWLQRIRQTSLPNDELYHCGFLHNPEGWLSGVEQCQRVREIGIPNVFFFLPTLGFVEPSRGFFDAHRDLAAGFPKDAKGWYRLLEERYSLVAYLRSAKHWRFQTDAASK
jgi:hypothetical protein